nr:MAG TPA: hypothetical protein [Caudoviricetes sp.]
MRFLLFGPASAGPFHCLLKVGCNFFHGDACGRFFHQNHAVPVCP